MRIRGTVAKESQPGFSRVGNDGASLGGSNIQRGDETILAAQKTGSP
jgi:hypothetical protein